MIGRSADAQGLYKGVHLSFSVYSGFGVHEVLGVRDPQTSCRAQWIPGAVERSPWAATTHQLNN
jgi:hypothetical protein